MIEDEGRERIEQIYGYEAWESYAALAGQLYHEKLDGALRLWAVGGGELED